VCLGNIIRSPLAENLFISHAAKAGVGDKYEVGSGGTGAAHLGESPDPRMRRVAARYGLQYDGSAKRFERGDFDRYDLIIAMDQENRDFLRSLARTPEQKEKIRMLREFDPDGGKNLSVPDPYYGGANGFEEVYHIIDRSTRGLLETLEKQTQTEQQRD
jgi:protein-tyrosine phosphatase